MRCEGWIRKGGAFTLGPVVWEQCENEAVVSLKGVQGDNENFEQPACMECWNMAISYPGMKIAETMPLEKESE